MQEKKNEGFIPIAARERGPGPGRYRLPTTTGFFQHDKSKHMKAAYSFGKRLYDHSVRGRDGSGSTGPVHFVNPLMTRHGRDGTPSYSILGRPKEWNSFITPSPGAYCPEKVHPQGERHAPNYSMSTRTRYRKRDGLPAPNSYELPALVGAKQPTKLSFPSYSMTGRSMIGSYCEDLHKTPGPDGYSGINPDIIAEKKPQYTLRARTQLPGDTTQKPGPGAHRPERVTINKPCPPRYSLGIRHSEFITPLIIRISQRNLH